MSDWNPTYESLEDYENAEEFLEEEFHYKRKLKHQAPLDPTQDPDFVDWHSHLGHTWTAEGDWADDLR